MQEERTNPTDVCLCLSLELLKEVASKRDKTWTPVSLSILLTKRSVTQSSQVKANMTLAQFKCCKFNLSTAHAKAYVSSTQI